MSSGNDEAVHLDARRVLVCMEVAWEIDALAILLAQQDVDPEDLMRHLLVLRGVCGRIRRLSSVLMSAVGEPEMSTEHLQRILGGDA